MRERPGEFIVRKLKATLLSTFIFALALGFWTSLTDEGIIYNPGTHFIDMVIMYAYYTGIIVAIYGNVIAVIIEIAQRKWFERANWLYVLVLGVFGSAIGFYYQYNYLVYIGIFAAVLYAVIDKWLLKRWQEDKDTKRFFVIPTVVFLVLWGYFQFFMSPLPPLTQEKVMATATNSGSDPIAAQFPKKASTWKGIIDGYQVERTTIIEQEQETVFIVTFTEIWQKRLEKGSWTSTYEVARNSRTLRDKEGALPPYYNKETTE